MARLTFSGTCIGYTSHVIATIRTVTYSYIDALVGQKSGHQYAVDVHITQQVVEIRGIEQARRGLGQNDLVANRRDHIDHLCAPGSFGHVEARNLVIQATVSAIKREVLYYREHDFNAHFATSYLQVRDIGNGSIASLVVKERLDFGFRFANSSVLYINDQQYRAFKIDWSIPGKMASQIKIPHDGLLKT